MEENKKILRRRMNLFNRRKGPRVGDFLKYRGVLVRFSHDWGDRLQTSRGGSYYLGDGYIEMSGGLEHGIEKKYLVPTRKKRSGSVWFFDRDIAVAGGGRDFKIPFRVFKIYRGVRIDPYNIIGNDLCPKCRSTSYVMNMCNLTYTCEKCGYTQGRQQNVQTSDRYTKRCISGLQA